MKINPIPQQNNISHKAYFKPNANFKKLFGEQITHFQFMDNAGIKKFKELPNHELEIIDIIRRDSRVSRGAISCTVFNNVTKKALTYNIDTGMWQLEQLMHHFCQLTDEAVRKFFDTDHDSIENFKALTSPREIKKI
ncbi:hypothetical protein IJD34_07190 [bacterium]|nr:hypothetical protein [bacterium]